MRVLALGDICGSIGRQAVRSRIPYLKEELNIDFVNSLDDEIIFRFVDFHAEATSEKKSYPQSYCTTNWNFLKNCLKKYLFLPK